MTTTKAIPGSAVQRSNQRGRARVLSVKPSGEHSLAVRVLVDAGAKPPFVANLKTGATDKARAKLVVGRTLPVDVPDDPRLLLVRWEPPEG